MSERLKEYRWIDRFGSILIGCAALLVFALTLAPTVTAEDSGELIAAAWHFGIPHPPGYPLWEVKEQPATPGQPRSRVVKPQAPIARGRLNRTS